MKKQITTSVALATLALAPLAHAQAQACTPAPPGLVAWWPGDGDANDLQGNHHGALHHGAGFAAGRVDQAFDLDGDLALALVPHAPGLNIGTAQDFTLDAWIYLDSLRPVPPQGADDEVISKIDIQRFRDGRSRNGYRLYVVRGAPFILKMQLLHDGSPYEVDSLSGIPEDQWTHVAAVRSGAHVAIYINGALDSSGAATAGTLMNEDPFAIGGVFDSLFGQYDPPVERWNGFGGLIDEVELFDRALTADEVRGIYEAGAAGKCKAPRIGCSGFEPPMADYPVAVKGKRALPLKAALFDAGGFEVTNLELAAPPVVQVWFDSGDGNAVDVSGDALPVGLGDEGNQFVFTDEGKWQFNLKTSNYSSPGIYTVFMDSGDDSEYFIEPTCVTEFVIR